MFAIIFEVIVVEYEDKKSQDVRQLPWTILVTLSDGKRVFPQIAHDNELRFHITDEGLSISRNVLRCDKSQWQTIFRRTFGYLN